MSSTTGSGLQAFTDYGSLLNSSATATHHLTLYRAPSGALVFGAGTVQWSWGLSNTDMWSSSGPIRKTRRIRTCSRQRSICSLTWAPSPTTLQTGLVAATQSTDTTPPTSTITSPTAGADFQDNSSLTDLRFGDRCGRRRGRRGRGVDRRRFDMAPGHDRRLRCDERQLDIHLDDSEHPDDNHHGARRR